MILHSEILAQPERLTALLNHQNRRYWILRVPFKKMRNMFSSLQLIPPNQFCMERISTDKAWKPIAIQKQTTMNRKEK